MKKMRLSKKPSSEEKDAFKQIKKYFKTDDSMCSMLMTYMGMMSIMLDFITENYGDEKKIHDLPKRTKYAVCHAIYHYKLLGEIVRGDITPDSLEMRWMPLKEDAWSSLDEITSRMIVVVKELHRQLQEEGKL